MFKITKINLNQAGLLKYFGELELNILEYLWKHDSMTIQEFYNYRQNNNKPIHANTITTVAKRMVNKKLLKTEQGIISQRYYPRLTPKALKKEIQDVINVLKKDI